MNVVMKVGKGGVGSQYSSSETWKTEKNYDYTFFGSLPYFSLIYKNLSSYKVFVAKTSFKFFNNLHASECS